METPKQYYTSSSSNTSDDEIQSSSSPTTETKRTASSRRGSNDRKHLYQHQRNCSLQYLASIASTNCEPILVSKSDHNNNNMNDLRSSSSYNKLQRRNNIIASTSSTNFHIPSVSTSDNHNNTYTSKNNATNATFYGNTGSHYSQQLPTNYIPAVAAPPSGSSMDVVDTSMISEDQRRTILETMNFNYNNNFNNVASSIISRRGDGNSNMSRRNSNTGNTFRRLSCIDIEPIPLESVSSTSFTEFPHLPINEQAQQQQPQQAITRSSDHQHKQKFLIFIYILFKLIDDSTKISNDEINSSNNSQLLKNTSMKIQAKQTVKECTYALRLGIQGSSPLIHTVIMKLSAIEGIEEYWIKADKYFKSFWTNYLEKKITRNGMMKKKNRTRDDGVVISGESVVGKFDIYIDSGNEKKRHKCDQSFIAQV